MKYTLTLITFFFAASVAAESLPSGWVFTTPDQYLKEDIAWFKGIPPNKVIADFNADQINDTAWILTDKKKTKYGLFVSLSTSANKHKIIKLDESEIKHHISLGISAQKPGKYKTACGKGYWECDKDEPAILTLNSTCISYYVFESAKSIFCWSKKYSEFKRIWMSD